MVEKRDYYEVLNVPRTTGADAVKRAYRRLALKYHPDNYQGDKAEAEVRFKELAEAYEVLSDPEKRQRYDRFGHQGLRGAGIHDFSSMGMGDIFSMFNEIFGEALGGFGRRGPRPGYDLATEVEVALQEVATGVDRTLEFERLDFCDRCGGSGAERGTAPQRCPACDGYGRVETSGGGFFRMVRTCPQCRGKGTVVTTPCSNCGGSGRMHKKRVLTVRIPPGVEDGQVLRIRGEGQPGEEGGLRGDLRCYVRVQPHPLLTRSGNDVVCRVPVSFTQAALGTTVEVPTLSGKEDVVIPPGAQYGEVITLKGRGLVHPRTGKKGHQLVQVIIEVPKKLSRRERELLRELAEIENIDVLPVRKGFFEKLKEYFGCV